MQNALANHGTVEHQWAQYGEVRADILVVKTTIADVDKAMAEMSTQVQAQIKDVTASLEDKLTATVDATSATAIHTLKVGVRINDIFYGAGMSIAVLAEAGKPVVTRVGFNANQFVLMSGTVIRNIHPLLLLMDRCLSAMRLFRMAVLPIQKLVILSSRITSLQAQLAGALIKMETLNCMENSMPKAGTSLLTG